MKGHKIMKKPFKDTKAFKVLKLVGAGAWDVLPLPNLRTFFDTDGDGKITTRDLKGIAWLKLAGAVIAMAILLKLGIIDMDQVIELIKALIA